MASKIKSGEVKINTLGMPLPFEMIFFLFFLGQVRFMAFETGSAMTSAMMRAPLGSNPNGVF